MVKLLILVLGLTLFAEDKPARLPLPAERQEAISRLMITLQTARLEFVEAQRIATDKKAAMDVATKQYDEALAQAQKEFGAPGCDLSVDKQWVCPKEK